MCSCLYLLAGILPAKEDSMADHYRKKNGSDTWHFCSNCSNWPTSDFVKSSSKPTDGELCDQCKGKRAKDDCS